MLWCRLSSLHVQIMFGSCFWQKCSQVHCWGLPVQFYEHKDKNCY